MRVYRRGQFDIKGGCVLAMGSFDALHKGHIRLLEEASCRAKKYGVKSGVHLFSERIENVIFGTEHKSIYTNESKIQIIENTGLDFVYFEDFDNDFMNISAYDFAKMLKEDFGAVCIVAGFHYTFGRNGEGDADLLRKLGKEFGFEVVIVEAVTEADIPISSTQIRMHIENGEISDANMLLGRQYMLSGKVIRDRGVGKTMKIPTANIKIDKKIILPQKGVYATYVIIDKKMYPSVTNIGIRPTFNLSDVTIETHIIDFDGDLYENELQIYFLNKLRNEKKFDTREQLVSQIYEDINKTRDIFIKNIG